MDNAGQTPVVPRPALSGTVQFIAWYARLTPHATAVVEAGVMVSYAELATDLLRYVRALEDNSSRPGRIMPGMLVGVETAVRYLHLQLLLACEVIGATSVSLASADLSADNEMLRGCDLLLTSRTPAQNLRVNTLVVTDGWLAEVAAQAVGPEDLGRLDQDIPGDRIVRICRSSGTTGAPKLIAMSQATQQSIVANYARAYTTAVTPRLCCLCIYNLALRAAYLTVVRALQHGGVVYFSTTTEVPGLIESGTVNSALFMVGDLQRLVRDARPPPPGHVLQIGAIGATVSPHLRRQVRDRWHAQFVNSYSSVELGWVALIGEDEVGTLFPGAEVRIVDDLGRDCPPGAVGLIRARTETMVQGYLNNPTLTEADFVDGWFRTSDLGMMPAPGRLVVLGRADDALNIGGVKVLPTPIEARIKAIEGVVDAVIVSVDDRRQIPTLLVAVETVDGTPPHGLAEQLNPIVSPYQPSFVLLMLPKLPRTDSGKVRRTEVAAIYARALAQDRTG